MRWTTYNRLDERAQTHEKTADCDNGLAVPQMAVTWRND
jgi:hypothetical protein